MRFEFYSLMVAALISLVSATVTNACSVPVFRYALERWQPDTFQALVLHRGSLSDEQKELIDALERSEGKNRANVELVTVDLDAAPPPELYFVDSLNHRVQARCPRLTAPSSARHAPPRLPRQAFAPDRHGRMRFARAFGGFGHAPGQFKMPWGVAVVRGLLVVSENDAVAENRLQVLTPKGVPLQVLTLGENLRRMCVVDDKRVWVADAQSCVVHALSAS